MDITESHRITADVGDVWLMSATPGNVRRRTLNFLSASVKLIEVPEA